MNEPCFDIAHLGHVEIFSNKFEESIHFFSKVYGLTITEWLFDNDQGKQDAQIYAY